MFIVVSNINKIPKELDGFQVELWSSEEFLERAYSDDGLDLDEGLWYHTIILTKELYDALESYVESGDIKFYRFNTDPAPSFEVNEKVCIDPNAQAPVFESEPGPVEEVKVDITPKIKEEPEEEPEPTYSAPVVETPTPPVAPVQPVVPTISEPVQPVVSAPVQPVVPEYMPPVPPASVVAPVVPTIKQPAFSTPDPSRSTMELAGGLKVAGDITPTSSSAVGPNAELLVDSGEFDAVKKSNKPATIVMCGSAKGGTGKTFTSCMMVYRFAKTHPHLKIAFADFDVIDGQIAVTTNQVGPTVRGFYKDFEQGHKTFEDLKKYKAVSEKFGLNLDFYLAPSRDEQRVSENLEFWKTIFDLLRDNYDVVFYDTGIDYMNKKLPIQYVYKNADRIIITSNTSINSVRSIIKQIAALTGQQENEVYKASDGIKDKLHIILTRVSNEYEDVNELVVNSLSRYAPIDAAFGNIDSLVNRVEWGGAWYLIDEKDDIIENLDNITKIE